MSARDAKSEFGLALPPFCPGMRPDSGGMVPVNDIQMSYAVFGTGEPVLLLHGGLANAGYWNWLVPDLVAHGFQAIIADSRGHGRSTRSVQDLSYDLMASDVLGLLDRLRIARAHLVGWSDGGVIGLTLAIHHPARLRSLFTYGAHSDLTGVRPGFAEAPAFAAFVARAADEYRALSPTPGEYGAFLGQIARMWATQPNFSAEELAGIRLRSAICAGAHDEGIARAHTEYMAQTIPGAELIILDGLGHFGLLQDPERFNAAVIGFLTGTHGG